MAEHHSWAIFPHAVLDTLLFERFFAIIVTENSGAVVFHALELPAGRQKREIGLSHPFSLGSLFDVVLECGAHCAAFQISRRRPSSSG